jgi:hypothetical protein
MRKILKLIGASLFTLVLGYWSVKTFDQNPALSVALGAVAVLVWLLGVGIGGRVREARERGLGALLEEEKKQADDAVAGGGQQLPIIHGRILEARIDSYGDSDGGLIKNIEVLIKVGIANRSDTETTFTGASLVMEVDGFTFKSDRIAISGSAFIWVGNNRERPMDLLKSITYENPLRKGNGLEGWLLFHVKGLRAPKVSFAPDITVILTDNFDKEHRITAKSVPTRI